MSSPPRTRGRTKARRAVVLIAMIVRRATSADVIVIKACVEASLQATYGGLWTSEPLVAGDRNWGR